MEYLNILIDVTIVDHGNTYKQLYAFQENSPPYANLLNKALLEACMDQTSKLIVAKNLSDDPDNLIELGDMTLQMKVGDRILAVGSFVETSWVWEIVQQLKTSYPDYNALFIFAKLVVKDYP